MMNEITGRCAFSVGYREGVKDELGRSVDQSWNRSGEEDEPGDNDQCIIIVHTTNNTKAHIDSEYEEKERDWYTSPGSALC